MTKFVLLSLFFLGWAFYEISGGKEFAPEEPARIAKYKALEAERAEAAREAERARKTAIAEKARNREAERAAMQVASLDLSGTQAALEQAALVTQTPLTRRQTLFSDPTPTPEAERAAIGPDPTAEPDPAILAAAAQAELPEDLRKVRGSRVNMRGGPGTSYAVLTTLSRGDEVKVLRESDNGWVKLKVVESGRIGWMSAKLLTKVE